MKKKLNPSLSLSLQWLITLFNLHLRLCMLRLPRKRKRFLSIHHHNICDILSFNIFSYLRKCGHQLFQCTYRNDVTNLLTRDMVFVCLVIQSTLLLLEKEHFNQWQLSTHMPSGKHQYSVNYIDCSLTNKQIFCLHKWSATVSYKVWLFEAPLSCITFCK